MMRPWLSVTVVLLLDMAFRVFFRAGAWTPDLVLLALAYVALTAPLETAYLLAFAAGLFWDGAFLETTGLHSLLFVLAVMITAKLRQVLWARYAASRFLIGFAVSGFVRFGESIFWLSNMDHTVSIANVREYILYGALMTGFAFLFVVWRTKPIRIARKTPMIVFSER